MMNEEVDPTTPDTEPTGHTPEMAAEPEAGEQVAPAEQADVVGEPAPEGEAADDLSELDRALLRVAELEEEVARRKADLYNLGQEYNGYVKRSKAEAHTQYEAGITKVLDTLLSVLDDVELARQHGDLTGPVGTVMEKLEQTLETNFGLVRFGEVGDDFNPEHHEALMNQTSPEVATQQVQHLIQPGYKQGERVIRPARVGVVSPE